MTASTRRGGDTSPDGQPRTKTGPAGSPALGAQRDAAIEARVWATEEYRLFPSAEDVFDRLPDEDADWMYDDAPEEARAWDDDDFEDADEEFEDGGDCGTRDTGW